MSMRFLQIGLIPPLLFSTSVAVKAQAFGENRVGVVELRRSVLDGKPKEIDKQVGCKADHNESRFSVLG